MVFEELESEDEYWIQLAADACDISFRSVQSIAVSERTYSTTSAQRVSTALMCLIRIWELGLLGSKPCAALASLTQVLSVVSLLANSNALQTNIRHAVSCKDCFLKVFRRVMDSPPSVCPPCTRR
jgi:hypothetical protein